MLQLICFYLVHHPHTYLYLYCLLQNIISVLMNYLMSRNAYLCKSLSNKLNREYSVLHCLRYLKLFIFKFLLYPYRYLELFSKSFDHIVHACYYDLYFIICSIHQLERQIFKSINFLSILLNIAHVSFRY